MTPIEYCTEEVTRQGHDIGSLDGIERVGWMLDGWSYAMAERLYQPAPTISDLENLGRLVERYKNAAGFRVCGVQVGSHLCPSWMMVQPLLEDLFYGSAMPPMQFYKELLKVHPFLDGNGRVGKVILNWLNGTLLNPIFPPDDLWGKPIRNP